MTQEEKAKAYDKALERAKEQLEGAKVFDYKEGQIAHDIRTTTYAIFPELKEESEDEKIRKEIISFIQDHIDEINLQVSGDYDTRDKEDIALQEWCKKAIAWLEKQGNKDKLIKELGEYKVKYTQEVLGRQLEKQGEQKFEMKTAEESLGISSEEYNDIVNECLYGEKPADKVEPKFKIGDWILYSGDHYEGVRHITKINENGYYIERNGLPHGIIPFNHEICMRLWTIKDAKDGDVLINWNNTAFIFKTIEDETVKFHIAYNEKWEAIKTPSTTLSHMGLPEPQFEFHPATKEQRDTLLKAMVDAGWEFDFEKKELKKIEKNIDVNHEHFSELLENDDSKDINYYAYQVAYCMSHDWIEETATWDDVQKACKLGAEWKEKHLNNSLTAWCEDDENKIDTIINIYHPSPNIVNWLKSLKDRMQPKQEWNEEDETILNNLIYALANDRVGNNRNEYVEWLKSLKDRVQPQPKQEWSEEDETNLTNTIIMLKEGASHHFTNFSIVPCVEWLKSLKERYTWKPTYEQMKALSEASGIVGMLTPRGTNLQSLYNDLKKLREK